MLAVRVEVVGVADGAFPGWVEVALVDAAGVRHTFVEKEPVLAWEPGPAIACEIVGTGAGTVMVETARPWGTASTAGRTRFEVRPDQLIGR